MRSHDEVFVFDATIYNTFISMFDFICFIYSEMSFKIVSTREKGKDFLSVVPHLWENNGVLKWPEAKQISEAAFKAMSVDGSSQPMVDWKAHQCTLKRHSLPTYKEAVEISKKMGFNSDTDASSHTDESTALPNKRKVLNRNVIGRAPDVDFTNMVCIYKYAFDLNVKAGNIILKNAFRILFVVE